MQFGSLASNIERPEFDMVVKKFFVTRVFHEPVNILLVTP